MKSWRVSFFLEVEVSSDDVGSLEETARDVLTRGDYDKVQATFMEWVEVDPLTGLEVFNTGLKGAGDE